VRFDQNGMFDDVASWSKFDVSSLAGGAKGYIGAAYDGKYLYLAPFRASSTLHGVVARFDTKDIPLLPASSGYSFF
jgi:hypothetical protein